MKAKGEVEAHLHVQVTFPLHEGEWLVPYFAFSLEKSPQLDRRVGVGAHRDGEGKNCCFCRCSDLRY